MSDAQFYALVAVSLAGVLLPAGFCLWLAARLDTRAAARKEDKRSG